MDDFARQEFTALRETIRSRGGARPIVFLIGLATWAVLLVGIVALLANPIASVVPLLVLLGTFEAVRSLHLGVERIGRYVQVFFEEPSSGRAPIGAPAWEHTAMVFGPSIPGAGVHPFFLPVFILATSVNLLAVWLPGPLIVEAVPLLVPHLAFVLWMFYCDRGMRKQRAAELARFREIRSALAGRAQ
jgi:hypothetical protein